MPARHYAPLAERFALLASVCEFHHLYGWATANRPALREYLRSVA